MFEEAILLAERARTEEWAVRDSEGARQAKLSFLHTRYTRASLPR
jgi:hypothetical protein